MNLKFTKNQLLVLGIFFANLGKTFYLREIARMLGKQPGVFQKDINNLESQGLLKSSYRGKSRFFELNKNYPLFKEIKSIINKTSGVESALASQLKTLANIQKAYIYGSYAAGTADNFSDIDLLIIGEPDQNKLNAILTALEKQFDREINYTLYSAQEFNKKKRTNQFLKEVLNKKLINLI